MPGGTLKGLDLKFYNLFPIFDILDEIQDSNRSQIPIFQSFDKIIEWFTLPKDFKKSVKITSTWELDKKAFNIYFWKTNWFVTVVQSLMKSCRSKLFLEIIDSEILGIIEFKTNGAVIINMYTLNH